MIDPSQIVNYPQIMEEEVSIKEEKESIRKAIVGRGSTFLAAITTLMSASMISGIDVGDSRSRREKEFYDFAFGNRFNRRGNVQKNTTEIDQIKLNKAEQKRIDKRNKRRKLINDNTNI